MVGSIGTVKTVSGASKATADEALALLKVLGTDGGDKTIRALIVELQAATANNEEVIQQVSAAIREASAVQAQAESHMREVAEREKALEESAATYQAAMRRSTASLKESEDALEAEKKDWQQRVVVDTDRIDSANRELRVRENEVSQREHAVKGLEVSNSRREQAVSLREARLKKFAEDLDRLFSQYVGS